mmetsp:Transcript_10845/g.16674  ORF Transcript_10845/g.16674 Transcript_10845/m.16674 type:complete len:439 (-) Transcript_10845:63-1379(-)
MNPFDLTHSQELLLNILPRIAAAISLGCSINMMAIIRKSSLCKTRVYHRIMFGCAVNVSFLSLLTLWGSLALPKETGLMGAIGNNTTCSIQGFLYYWCLFITPLYYDSLSLISLIVWRKRLIAPSPTANSQETTGLVKPPPWLENAIHAFIIIVPLILSIYLLAKEAFNPGAWRCTVASSPFGCGDFSIRFFGEYVQCERGPENIGQLVLIFISSPIVFVVLFPAVMLISLYFIARRKGRKMLATSIFNQSFLYILLLLWTYMFRFISVGILFSSGEYSYVLSLLGNINDNLIGIWLFVVYLYFRTKDPSGDSDPEIVENQPMGRSRGSTRTMPMRYSYKPDFSIFDGGSIPTDSPWGAFITEGVDDDYSESEDVEIFQAANQISQRNIHLSRSEDSQERRIGRRCSRGSRASSGRNSINSSADDADNEYIPAQRRFS